MLGFIALRGFESRPFRQISNKHGPQGPFSFLTYTCTYIARCAWLAAGCGAESTPVPVEHPKKRSPSTLATCHWQPRVVLKAAPKSCLCYHFDHIGIRGGPHYATYGRLFVNPPTSPLTDEIDSLWFSGWLGCAARGCIGAAAARSQVGQGASGQHEVTAHVAG